MPLFLRLFIRDAVEGVLASVLAFTVAGDPNAQIHAIIIAGSAAVIAAARRNFSPFIDWLNQKLNTPPNSTDPTDGPPPPPQP